MNGIMSNQRYVNLSKVDDIQLDGESIVTNGVANLNEVVTAILAQVYNTLAESNYTKQEVNDLIANRSGFTIVASLPNSNISPNKIYLVPIQNDDNENDTDAYDEFIYVNNSWEHVGSFQADFSAYSTTAQVQTMLDTALNALQTGFTTLQTNFTALQNHVGNIDAVLDAINGEVV